MDTLFTTEDITLYRLEDCDMVERYIATTPETRLICNDPFVVGIDYTRGLQRACTQVLEALKGSTNLSMEERAAMVLHILRGGLNYGLRDALADAFTWNRHTSAYISSQRAKDEAGQWYITENRYAKVYIPNNASIYFGDVVATGVSLEHAVQKIIDMAVEQKKTIRDMTFFTIGGDRSEQILAAVDKRCRQLFPGYQTSRVIYFEGVFGVADESSKLQIKLTGTDLLRSPALLAPEFAASQMVQPAYAIERCTIYDAGSRAFHVEEYLEDVADYWQQVQQLAAAGTTYAAYVRERFPEDERLNDTAWVTDNDTSERLAEIAAAQLEKCR